MIALEMSGKTIEEAIENGMEKWNLKKDEVEIEVVDKGKRGFLMFEGKPAIVRFKIKSVKKSVEVFTGCFLECLGWDYEYNVKEGKRSYSVDFTDESLLDKYQPKVFSSIEHIINKSLSDILEGVPVYVCVNGKEMGYSPSKRRVSIKGSDNSLRIKNNINGNKRK